MPFGFVGGDGGRGGLVAALGTARRDWSFRPVATKRNDQLRPPYPLEATFKAGGHKGPPLQPR
jgi:hypothetical protein